MTLIGNRLALLRVWRESEARSTFGVDDAMARGSQALRHPTLRLRPATAYGTGYSRATAYSIGRTVMPGPMARTISTLLPPFHRRRATRQPFESQLKYSLFRRCHVGLIPGLDTRQVLQGAIEQKLRVESATLIALPASSRH